MSQLGRLVAVSSAVVLFLSTAISAHAEEPIPEVVPDEVVSLRDVLASGTVRNPDGRALAGVEVMAVIWPESESLRNLQEGDGFNTPMVDSVRTDATGRYRLSTRNLPQGEGTPITVEFVAVTDAGPTSWFTTIDTTNGLKAHQGDLKADAAARAAGIQRLSTPRAGVALGKAAAAGAGLALDFTATGEAMPAGEDSGLISVAAAPTNCTLKANLGAKLVTVGQTYATVSGGHTRKFTYTSSAKSTVGVAGSVSGAYGSWTVSGTTSAISTASVGFPLHSDATGHTLKTNFSFGRYQCSYGTVPITAFRVYPMGFAGGATVGTVSVPSATYCVSQVAGSEFTKSSTAAITWSNGVALKSAIGIDVSAKTGYSTQAKLAYKFSSTRRMCGQSGYPASTPYTIVVKA